MCDLRTNTHMPAWVVFTDPKEAWVVFQMLVGTGNTYTPESSVLELVYRVATWGGGREGGGLVFPGFCFQWRQAFGYSRGGMHLNPRFKETCTKHIVWEGYNLGGPSVV